MAGEISRAEIAMALEYSGYARDLNTVKRMTQDGMGDMVRSADALKYVMGALGAALSVGSFVNMVRNTLNGAAAMHDLSIATGVSVAGLQQFRAIGAYTDTTMESIAGASIKLSKSLAVADEDGKGAALAIKALGIDLDSFRQLAPEQQMLQVARALGEFKDGADKTAAATMMFGKEGAKLLPFLGDLGEQADKVASKLGAQESETRALQAAMADAFGDNLTAIRKQSAGWERELSMGLLPALYEASEAVLGMAGGTGGLKAKIAELARDGTLADWARGAMTAFSYLIDVAQGLFTLFPMLGKVIAGVAAGTSTLFGGIFEAMNRLKSGDVTGAWDSLKGGFAGVKTIAVETGNDIGKIWGQELLGAKFRERMDDLKGVQVQAKAAKKDLNLVGVLAANEAARKREAEAAKAAAAEQKRLIAEYERAVKAGQDLVRTIEAKNDELQVEVDLGRKLTVAEKENLKLTKDLAEGKIVLTASEEMATRALIDRSRALEVELSWLIESTKQNEAAADARIKESDALRDAVDKQREAVAVIGLNARALADREAAAFRDAAAAKERLAVVMEDVDWTGKQSKELRDQAALLRERATLAEQGVVKKEAQDAAAEWKKTTDSIADGLTDALFRGFEGGKSLWVTFRDTIVNGFKTLVLQPTIRGIMAPVAMSVGSLFGAGDAAAMGTANNTMGLLNNGSSVYSMYGKVTDMWQAYTSGNAAMAASGAYLGGMLGADALSAGAIYGGAAGGATLTGASTLTGGGALVGEGLAGGTLLAEGGAAAGAVGAEGAMAAMGPYGWAALAVIAAAAYFSKGQTLHKGGYALAGPDGSVTDITAAQQGIQDAQMQQVVGAFASSAAGMINDTAKLFGETADVAVRSVFESDRNDPSWGVFAVLNQARGQIGGFEAAGTLDKDPQKGFQQFVDQAGASIRDALVALDLPEWVDKTLKQLGDSPTFKQLSDALDGIRNFEAALHGMADAVAPIGGIFERIGGLSSDARAQLAQFAGGIDAFVSKTAAYVKNYYSDQEQAALAAKRVLATLQGIGIDGSGATAAQDLRAVMESLDLTTEEGRRRMAGLLDVQQAYFDVAQTLQETGLTLGQLAAGAPPVALLEELQDPMAATAEATADTALSSEEIAGNTAETVAAVSELGADVTLYLQDSIAAFQEAGGQMVGPLQTTATASTELAASATATVDLLQELVDGMGRALPPILQAGFTAMVAGLQQAVEQLATISGDIAAGRAAPARGT